MKKLLLLSIVVTAFLFSNETKAQVRFNVNVNLGARPSWGLPGNYAGDYYYFPEIDSYYDIPNHQFIYFDGRDWEFTSELPSMYRDYDLYNGYKVIVNEYRPYLHGDYYRDRYRSYYNTYRAPVMMAQRNPIRYNNDRYYGGRSEERFENRRNTERFENRRDYGHNERGRGNEHENDRGRGHRDRD